MKDRGTHDPEVFHGNHPEYLFQMKDRGTHDPEVFHGTHPEYLFQMKDRGTHDPEVFHYFTWGFNQLHSQHSIFHFRVVVEVVVRH